MSPVPAFLTQTELRLILFAGKGGVGKTTCAAATALRLAKDAPAERFLVVSVDPAHSLADALAGEVPPSNLEVIELDAGACLQEFIDRHRETLREIARRGTFLDEEDIQRFVDLSLPGMDELFAFLRIAEWTRSSRYRTVIVDTAPSGHTHRLLDVPSLLHGWVSALDALLAKHRYLAEHFRGEYTPDHTDRLLHELAEAAGDTQRLLQSAQSCLVPVILAEPLSVFETGRFLFQVAEQQVRVGPLVVNRLRPDSGCAQCHLLYEQQRATLSQHAAALTGHELWGLPLLPAEVRGLANLLALGNHLVPLQITAPSFEPVSVTTGVTLPPQVDNPGTLPPAERRLLLFAGKGGVGKTTLACATALRLAAAGRPVILLSTDPAHSLGDCLGTPIGAQRVTLSPELSALAPDAQAEWSTWRHLYDDEVEALWQKRLVQTSLAFERQALDRLLDLSPPGLDELVALTRVTELLAELPGATLVIDTAPTGHLLRLLALPEVLDSWLKAIFAVLLKNRQVVRLPRLTDRLIDLSKRLKVLRAMLADARRAAVYAVAIPTWLAFAETGDLLAACQKLGVAVARVLVNQVTTARGDCALCRALAARESVVLAALKTKVAPVPVSVVALQAPPRGQAALGTLGQLLYNQESGGVDGPHC